MISNKERREHIEAFRDHVTSSKVRDKELTRKYYYIALVCDKRIFKAKFWLQKANMANFHLTVDSILATLDENPANNETIKETVISILQFHLDAYSGHPATEKVLLKIEKDLNKVVQDIFSGSVVKVKVENVSNSSEKFKVLVEFL